MLLLPGQDAELTVETGAGAVEMVPGPTEVVVVGVVEGIWVVLCPTSVDVEVRPDVDPPDEEDTV